MDVDNKSDDTDRLRNKNQITTSISSFLKEHNYLPSSFVFYIFTGLKSRVLMISMKHHVKKETF